MMPKRVAAGGPPRSIGASNTTSLGPGRTNAIKNEYRKTIPIPIQPVADSTSAPNPPPSTDSSVPIMCSGGASVSIPRALVN